MSGIKDQAQIEELRKRLYERGSDIKRLERHTLASTSPAAPLQTDWKDSLIKPTAPTEDLRASVTEMAPVVELSHKSESAHSTSTARRQYRIVIVLASLFIFILGAGFSSFYLFLGTNQISATNIGLTLTGPRTLGGGEVLQLQIGINNQNPVPLESATLIVRYPNGTRSVDEPPRQLFEERISLETLPAGEIRNLTLQAAVFGEENTEHAIEAVVEYRVAGSNSLFERRADPLMYRISSSPVGLRLSVLDTIASGQELPMTLTIQSNAPTPLSNVLIRAEYPSTFSYSKAEPAPVSGQNIWLIETIEPNQSVTIEVRGILTGFADDEYQLRFVAGVQRAAGQYEFGGELARISESITIDQAMLGVRITANDSAANPTVLRTSDPITVAISITNTEAAPLRTVSIAAEVTGAMASGDAISTPSGQYDKDTRTLTWEVVGAGDLVTIPPGESRTVTFVVDPKQVLQSGSFTTDVSIRARRNETTAIIGTGQLEVQFAGTPSLRREVAFGTGTFATSGPVPPVVNEATTYVLSLAATAGVNRITRGVVTTNLPPYVTWLDQSTGPGTVEFNPVTRQIRWVVGDVEARETAVLSFPIRFIPSTAQVDSSPLLLQESVLQANDAFTGTLERATVPGATTELSTELGFPSGNGQVIPRN